MLWRVGILETVSPLIASSKLASGEKPLGRGAFFVFKNPELAI